jgi:5'-nucleotidase (lipoprotein e(P4) family)
MPTEKRINFGIKKSFMRKIIPVVVVLSILISCTNKFLQHSSLPENQDHLLLSVLWFQRSAEMQAMFYQGYNIARSSLAEKLNNSDNTKPKAVVLDIDETILNNSPFEAFQVINNVSYSDDLWNKWVNKTSAGPLPGALEFTRFAESKSLEVFYITNRESPIAYFPTLKNLNDKGFPFADSLHIIFKTSSSSKEDRRKTISTNYEILLLIGDNLADFDVVFDKRGEYLGFEAVKENINKFGERFIILPNPMYGPWINAATGSQQGETMREKILKALKAF